MNSTNKSLIKRKMIELPPLLMAINLFIQNIFNSISSESIGAMLFIFNFTDNLFP